MAEMVDIELRLAKSRTKFLAYIRKRIADPELAEDILQDSFLKAVRGARQIRDENLVRWFYSILQNTIVDSYRRRAAEVTRRVNYAAGTGSGYEQEDKDAVCECVRELIPTLKPEYAEMAKLELDENDPIVAAQQLGITRNNLKVRMHRARQALRKRLEETCESCAERHCVDCSCKH